jgi:ABC-type glycerol-3-phosphate transport system substrate-binding protein
MMLVREDFSPRLDAPRVLVFSADSADLDEQLARYQADPGDEWVYLAFSASGDEGVVGMQSQMLGIVDQSPEQNLAAWQFIQFLAAPEAQAEWAAASGFLPVNAAADEVLAAQSDVDPQWLSLLDFAPLSQPDPNLPSWPIVQPAVEDALLAVLWAEDQSDLNENLAILMDTIAELVEEAR